MSLLAATNPQKKKMDTRVTKAARLVLGLVMLMYSILKEPAQ
jgi:hypothetical protein